MNSTFLLTFDKIDRLNKYALDRSNGGIYMGRQFIYDKQLTQRRQGTTMKGAFQFQTYT